jgi:hypothetical protein
MSRVLPVDRMYLRQYDIGTMVEHASIHRVFALHFIEAAMRG